MCSSRVPMLRNGHLPHNRPVRSSPRGVSAARAQLLHIRPDLIIVDLRGNLNTRFSKLTASTWGGMILARAGVVRLGWAERIGESLDPLTMLPAVGQGALGIEIRNGTRRSGRS